MLKKFFPSEDIYNKSQAKSSVARGIRKNIIEQYPEFEQYADECFPKKDNLIIAKCNDDLQFYIINKEPIFFSTKDGLYFPSLRVLQKYPTMMKRVQVDKGAIKFVISGANIMCPGLTSPGGYLPEENIEAGEAVAIFAEGKVNPLAIGQLVLSTDDIKKVNKGIGINNIHYLNDGLWNTLEIE
ncbi:hypothetical protein WA158_007219 [Blastocystis sp. Blastoise]